MKKLIIVLAAAAAVLCQTFGDDFFSRKLEFSDSTLNSFTLENGLTVYVIPDNSSATIHAEIAFKAGFSNQTSSTAGFFPLYLSLFTTSIPKEKQDIFEICSMKSQCNKDSTTFSANIPNEMLETFLKSFSMCLEKNQFSDKAIEKMLDAMKTENISYSKSPAAFINGTIESRIFSEQPWKHDSGIYPSIFSSWKPSEARTILYQIGNTYFTPQNAALFLSGNITVKEAVEKCSRSFASWSFIPTQHYFSKKEKTIESKSDAKKFVLASKLFSPEFIQIVVDYETFEPFEANLLSQIFNSDSSTFKQELAEDAQMGIRSTEYINVSSVQNKNSSRLIFQTLIEPSLTENNDTTLNLDKFILAIKKAAIIRRQDFIKAQEAMTSEYKKICGTPSSYIYTLANFWAQSSARNPNDFFDEVTDKVHMIYNTDEKSVAKKILREEPFVFVIVSRKTYDSQKELFIQKGYELVTEETGSWYMNEMNRKIAAEEKKFKLDEKNSIPQIAEFTGKDEISDADKFYYANLEKLSETTLQNGIPLVIKKTPGRQEAVISLIINTQELDSYTNGKAPHSLLINALSRNIDLEDVKTFTSSNYHSGIRICVPSEKIEEGFSKISEALIYRDITPVGADIIMNQENYERLIQNGDLGYQLKSNAFSYLYRGTPLEKHYALKEEKINPSYDSLLLGYTKLLDASLYSISVVAGDIETEKIEEAAQQYLGILKEQNTRKKIEIPPPSFKAKERSVKLMHTFTTNIPAEYAGTEVPVLVPTKEFFDPAQLYFVSQDSGTTDIFNALLLELKARIQESLSRENTCLVQEADAHIPVAFIQANSLKRISQLTNSYKTQRKKLYDELKNGETKDEVLVKIKSRWTALHMSLTKDSMGTAELIERGIAHSNPHEYLYSYMSVANADAQTMIKILQDSFPEENSLMKVYSADSKK